MAILAKTLEQTGIFDNTASWTKATGYEDRRRAHPEFGQRHDLIETFKLMIVQRRAIELVIGPVKMDEAFRLQPV